MTLFEKLKIFWLVRTAKDKIKEAYMAETTVVKPGWKTTEFWGKAFVQIGTVLSSVSGFLPPKWAALISMGMEVAYTIGRSVVKGIAVYKSSETAAPPIAPV